VNIEYLVESENFYKDAANRVAQVYTDLQEYLPSEDVTGFLAEVRQEAEDIIEQLERLESACLSLAETFDTVIKAEKADADEHHAASEKEAAEIAALSPEERAKRETVRRTRKVKF
jgi:hypothetical protein